MEPCLHEEDIDYISFLCAAICAGSRLSGSFIWHPVNVHLNTGPATAVLVVLGTPDEQEASNVNPRGGTSVAKFLASWFSNEVCWYGSLRRWPLLCARRMPLPARREPVDPMLLDLSRGRVCSESEWTAMAFIEADSEASTLMLRDRGRNILFNFWNRDFRVLCGFVTSSQLLAGLTPEPSLPGGVKGDRAMSTSLDCEIGSERCRIIPPDSHPLLPAGDTGKPLNGTLSIRGDTSEEVEDLVICGGDAEYT
eukprot:m.1049403 g.1049403  ORF g.1049403 m.1049403 type:complete len:252 (-) comp24173_c2_seq1:560-1315(-)